MALIGMGLGQITSRMGESYVVKWNSSTSEIYLEKDRKSEMVGKARSAADAKQVAQKWLDHKYTEAFRPCITEHPIGQDFKIRVSSPGYDDIGAVLLNLGLKFEQFNGNFNCNLLFLNCGSSDIPEPRIPMTYCAPYSDLQEPKLPDLLEKYVASGNILYASDLTASLLVDTFPGLFSFRDYGGLPEEHTAEVTDKELSIIVGYTIRITFDLGSWAVLESISKGETILRSKNSGLPIMVMVPYKQGKIFYTCFHNHAQISDTEEKLLKLLVLKQISVHKSQTIQQTGNQLGIDINKLRVKK